ncbi:MAG TPA: SDR family NAD(P)-dependent oxidoreductase [Thermoanaerobaculia bacterium]|nr:SDR family NAD(P)-dependent oxidoreductase [Thermoanaerobaculia bacterium]
MADGILYGQTAIVTGASRGLGRHVALELARRGVRVAVSARTEDELARVAEEIRGAGGEAIAVPIDVTQWEHVERGVNAVRAHFGGVDILVNNAGVGWYKPFEEHSIAELDLTLDVNLRGTMYMTKAVLPHIRQIVNVASDLGRRVIPNMVPYVASKFGVVGFAGALLREVKGKGVKVMTVTPGIIDTFFNGGAEGTKDESWSLRPQFVANAIVDMLELPPHWVVDEIAIHAMGQEF